MTTRLIPPIAYLLLSLAVVGCEVEQETEEVPDPQVQPEPGMGERPEAGAMPADTGMQPDTSADALWSHLQDADYAESWDFWPDKEPYYEGTEPHGVLLSTYLNSQASMAVGEGEFDELPSGSIIVKDNFEPDSTMASVTVMYKVEGYAPDAGDWFWAKYGPEGEVQASGHAQACLECHSEAAADHDYLMTAMAGQGGG